jgi:hypothetical protein
MEGRVVAFIERSPGVQPIEITLDSREKSVLVGWIF